MILHYFSDQQLCWLLLWAIMAIASIWFFENGSKTKSIAFLIVASFCSGYFAFLLDPFLNLWDEQYHALVAKNMVENPFKPMLYKDPVLKYDYTNWVQNHVWLHKQPLFMWQMALSIKLFGSNVFAVRLPSVIMHAFLAFLVYRIGHNALNARTGLYAGLFSSISFFPLELISGYIPTEHNDLAFLFYVTASLWAYTEYVKTQKLYWALLAGVLSGGAILIKWLTGLLVYAGWVAWILFDKRMHTKQHRIHLLAALLATFLVFAPWQAYILWAFPLESMHEYAFNSKHFYEAIEGHEGDAMFHIIAMDVLYGTGDLMKYLVVLAVLVASLKSKALGIKIAFLVWFIVVYVFFTLAATKMVSFCSIVSSVVFTGFGYLFASAISQLKRHITNTKLFTVLTIPIIGIASWLFLNLNDIANNHTSKAAIGRNRKHLSLEQVNYLQSLKGQLPAKTVIFTDWMFGHVPIMFFTDYTAYWHMPSNELIDSLSNKNHTLVLLADSVPQRLLQNKRIIIKEAPKSKR